MLIYPHNCKAALQHSANGSSGTVACHPSQRRTALLAVLLAAMLAVAVAVTGIVMHAGEPGQVAVPYPAAEGTIVDVILTGVLNAAYAVHGGALSLTPTSGITDADDTNLVLDLADDIAIFESGGHTYAAVTAPGDNGVQILNITNPSTHHRRR